MVASNQIANLHIGDGFAAAVRQGDRGIRAEAAPPARSGRVGVGIRQDLAAGRTTAAVGAALYVLSRADRSIVSGVIRRGSA
jgi:hypothetical protein